jgi:hypothetical protein
MASGAFDGIALREVDATGFKNYKTLEKFAHTVTCGAAVYLIPGTYPAIIRIDAESGDISYDTDRIAELESIKNEETWYLHGYALVGEKLFVTARCANAILEIDATGQAAKLHGFEQNDVNYYDVCHDGVSFWLATPRTIDGAVKLGKWDGIHSTIEFVEILPEEECARFADKLDIVFRILYCAGHVYVIPCHMDRALRIDLATNAVSGLSALQPECQCGEPPVVFDKFNAAWKWGNTIYALGGRSHKLYISNAAKGENRVAEIRGDISRAGAIAFRHDAKRCERPEDSIYADGELFDLGAFLETVAGPPDDAMNLKQSESAIEKYAMGKREAGVAIYAHCRDLLMGSSDSRARRAAVAAFPAKTADFGKEF